LPGHQTDKTFNATFNTIFDAIDVDGGGDVTLAEMVGFVGTFPRPPAYTRLRLSGSARRVFPLAHGLGTRTAFLSI
jgi:hypothetical protein